MSLCVRRVGVTAYACVCTRAHLFAPETIEASSWAATVTSNGLGAFTLGVRTGSVLRIKTVQNHVCRSQRLSAVRRENPNLLSRTHYNVVDANYYRFSLHVVPIRSS